MIIVPDRFIFLETPRTASKSCRHILSSVPGAVVSDQCHVGCEVALGAKFATKLPLITVTREPMAHLLSWYYACANKKKTFSQFIRNGLPIGGLAKRSGFDPYTLNPYKDIVDHAFKLDRGIVDMFSYLRIPVKKNPMINFHDVDIGLMNADTWDATTTHFAGDVEYYHSLGQNYVRF